MFSRHLFTVFLASALVLFGHSVQANAYLKQVDGRHGQFTISWQDVVALCHGMAA